MVSGAMRRNVSVAFSHFLLGRFPKDSRRLRFFFFLEAGGFPVFCFPESPSASFLLFIFPLPVLPFLPWQLRGIFCFIDKISRMFFSAADVSGKGMFSWSFPPKLFPQEVEMDFHRNAYGKSRLKCFSLPVSLVVLVVLKSFWWMLSIRCRPSRSMADDVASDLGLLVAHDHSWRSCCIMVSSARQYTICAV